MKIIKKKEGRKKIISKPGNGPKILSFFEITFFRPWHYPSHFTEIWTHRKNGVKVINN